MDYFFSLARNAMYVALQNLALPAGTQVLTAAWNCDGAVQPFRELGLESVFYATHTENFGADWYDIEQKISPKTKVLHLINHFGQSQDWEWVAQWRKKYDLIILEDNAYSLFSTYKGQKLGSFGDFSVFSLRKNLPLADGALLKINREEFKIDFTLQASPLLYDFEKSKLFRLWIDRQIYASSFLRGLLLAYRHFVPTAPAYEPPLYADKLPDLPSGEADFEFSYDWKRPISRFSYWEYQNYDEKKYEKIKIQKIRLYQKIVQKLSTCEHIEILFPQLDEGIVPFCVNLIVKKGRDAYLAQASTKKLPLMAWPSLPLEVLQNLEKYPDVIFLGKNLLQINLLEYASPKIYEEVCDLLYQKQ